MLTTKKMEKKEKKKNENKFSELKEIYLSDRESLQWVIGESHLM